MNKTTQKCLHDWLFTYKNVQMSLLNSTIRERDLRTKNMRFKLSQISFISLMKIEVICLQASFV